MKQILIKDYIPLSSRLFYRRQVDFCCTSCNHYERDVGMLTPYKSNGRVYVLCDYCKSK